MKSTLKLIVLTATLGLAGVALAAAPPKKDRDAILAMAGDYAVKFTFTETLTFDVDREPSPVDVTEAREHVLVVEDSPEFISLQHLLVVEAEGQKMIIKHWRQDWQYEPKMVTEYRGLGQWDRVKLKARDVKGAWSQTVFQVDDSPRYGGVGTWRHEGGLSFWEARETYRPLPRRETAQHKFYDVLVGTNRHTITPKGWAHEQDNYKLDLDEKGNRIIARETGLNTYDRISDYDFTPAKEYWDATAEFWTGVRARWNEVLTTQPSITLRNDGRSINRKILGMADELREGKFATLDEALAAFNAKLDAALAGDEEPEEERPAH
jgi:hypothetical protein